MADDLAGDVDPLVVSVRADTQAFAGDVAQLRQSLESSLGQGAATAGTLIEASLVKAVTSGKASFASLSSTAVSALNQIAAAALKVGISALTGTTSGGGTASLGSFLSSLSAGAPGRATGGPVSPGAAYMVGERGPELFVPTSSGRIDTGAPAVPRGVNVAITINAGGNQAPAALQQSSRQVARAVKAALMAGQP